MKLLRIYILYRLFFALGLLVAGILSHLFADVILAWILYILALVSVLLHFMIGTMRLVKDAVEDGDVDQALVYIQKIKNIENIEIESDAEEFILNISNNTVKILLNSFEGDAPAIIAGAGA